jgi:hypothetical protein
MRSEAPPARIIRVNSENEVLARAANLIVGRAAMTVRLYLRDRIERGGGRLATPAKRAARRCPSGQQACHVSKPCFETLGESVN